MDHRRFIEHVQARAGLETPELAMMTISATLAAIGRSLEHSVGSRVLELLPEPLKQSLRTGLESPERGGSFLADVAEHEQVKLSFAIEHASVVCEALAGELDDAKLTRLRQLVPDEVAQLLVRYHAPPSPRRHPSHGAHMHRNLAEGRPGSQQPLCDSPPWAGHADSLAVSSDPKSDSKLAAAKGARHGETLAAGRPGSSHPLTDVGD